MSLRDALKGEAEAKAAATDQTKHRETERARIRAKLCDTDRDFIDKIIETFPGAKLVGLRFSDGEKIGRSI